MSRYKRIIDDTLRSHTRPAQETESRIAVTVLPLSSFSPILRDDPVEPATSKAVCFAEHLRRALADDRARRLCVARGHPRHDGAIGDAQGIDPVDLQ
jgi:hypothetical protein